jgi:hypothetical protein
MGFELFVEEEVSRICDKAYFSVELLQQYEDTRKLSQ